jgi:hypothetical protein
MKTTYDKILNWYKKKPWWGKVLFVGVLVLPALLYVVNVFFSLIPTRKLPPPIIDAATPPFGRVNESIDEQIEAHKQELISKFDTVRQVGVRATERRQAIQNAATMEELDDLKKRFGL